MNTAYHLFKLGKLVAKEIKKKYAESNEELSKEVVLTLLGRGGMSVADNIALLQKYNDYGQFDRQLAQYYTYVHYCIYLADNTISYRKSNYWREFIAKDFSERYKESYSSADFMYMYVFLKEGTINLQLWQALVPQHKKYLVNDIITRFEKEYSTIDFASERRKEGGTPMVDAIIERFGEDKGTNLCAAIFTFIVFSIPPSIPHKKQKEFSTRWTEFCFAKIAALYRAQGIEDYNEAFGMVRHSLGSYLNEIENLGKENFLCTIWVTEFLSKTGKSFAKYFKRSDEFGLL